MNPVALFCLFSIIVFFLIRACRRRQFQDRERARQRREHLDALRLETSERRQAAVNFLNTQLNSASERQPDLETRTELIEKCINTVEVNEVKEIHTLIEDLRHNPSSDEEQSKSTRSLISVAWDSAKDSVRFNHSQATPECCICLEAYEKGDKISSAKEVKCIHVFHEECIASWLKENDDCPLCRCNILG